MSNMSVFLIFIIVVLLFLSIGMICECLMYEGLIFI